MAIVTAPTALTCRSSLAFDFAHALAFPWPLPFFGPGTVEAFAFVFAFHLAFALTLGCGTFPGVVPDSSASVARISHRADFMPFFFMSLVIPILNVLQSTNVHGDWHFFPRRNLVAGPGNHLLFHRVECETGINCLEDEVPHVWRA